MRWIVLCAALTSCVASGGPLVGYGQHGWFAGGDVSGGGEVYLPQLTLGYQSDVHMVYARADEAYDFAPHQDTSMTTPTYGTFIPGGRIGGGVGLDTAAFPSLGTGAHDDAKAVGVFAIGGSVGHALEHITGGPNSECAPWTTAAVVELQVRYADGWSVVLQPRIERGTSGCKGWF